MEIKRTMRNKEILKYWNKGLTIKEISKKGFMNLEIQEVIFNNTKGGKI